MGELHVRRLIQHAHAWQLQGSRRAGHNLCIFGTPGPLSRPYELCLNHLTSPPLPGLTLDRPTYFSFQIMYIPCRLFRTYSVQPAESATIHMGCCPLVPGTVFKPSPAQASVIRRPRSAPTPSLCTAPTETEPGSRGSHGRPGARPDSSSLPALLAPAPAPAPAPGCREGVLYAATEYGCSTSNRLG